MLTDMPPTPTHDEVALARRRDALRRADLRRRGRQFVALAGACAVGAIAIAVLTTHAGWSLAAAAVWFGARGVWLQRHNRDRGPDDDVTPPARLG